MKTNVGGLIAVIDPRGSRYATRGTLRVWMPVPGDGRKTDRITLEIDGETEAPVEISYAGPPLLAGNGYTDRYLYSIDLPERVFGLRIVLSLSNEAGLPVGVRRIKLDLDAQGDAILVELNDELRALLERTPEFIRSGKPAMAHFVYQQVYCAELFADHATLLSAAKAAADVFDIKSAEVLLDRALKRLPKKARLFMQVGNVLLKLDRFAEAKTYFDWAIELDPVSFGPRNGHIKALIGESNWPQALLEAHSLRSETAPDTSAYSSLCGTIAWLYLNVSDPERALAEASLALNLHPGDNRLMQMQADALVRLSRYDEAITIYRTALKSDPKAPLLRKRLASALMLVGQFDEAADQDSGRMSTPTFAKLNNVPDGLPIWRGELEPHGRLLVWAEVNFGVGQNLLHGSILPDLIALGLDIVLEVERRLVPVFAAAFPQIEVVEQVAPGETRGAWMNSIGCHLPIGSLVRFFRRERADFALSSPFLRHDERRTAGLREALLTASGSKRFLVGFSWTSNNPYVGDEKSVPLPQLLAALDLPSVALVNLQYGDHMEVIAEASAETGVAVLEAKEIDRTNDLIGMCDVVAAMDMVVCIGHTTAHLAGGLDVPNLVLVPSSPFSHWLGKGEACVWYPKSRILRQPPEERGDWCRPLAQASEYLALTVLGLDLPKMADASIPETAGAGEPDGLAIFYRNALTLAMAEYDYLQIDQIVAAIIERYPRHAGLLSLVGDCQFRIGNFETAFSAYHGAIEAGGDAVELTAKKVQVLLELYDLDMAATLLRQLFKANPQLQKTRPDLVLIEAQILGCQGRSGSAIAGVERLIEREPDNLEAAITLANAYSSQGAYGKAVDLLARTLEHATNGEVGAALGIAIGQAGMPDLGNEMIARAKSVGPDPLGTFWQAQFAKSSIRRSERLFQNGELIHPVAAEERVTVFVCMDTSYCLRYLGSIAASLAENSPGTNLHVHIVNAHDDARERLKAVELLVGSGRLSYGLETARLTNFSPEQRRTYFASIRFVRLAELMRTCPGTYFVMDVDNLLRGDVSQCLELTRNTDLLIRNRFSLRPHLAVAACGIVLANSDAARDFMNRAAEYILDAFHTGHVAWFLDQIALTIAMNEPPTDPQLKLRVAQLPRTLLDWDFAADSLVWTGKGKRRLRNRRYQAEYKRYQESFKHVAHELT